MRKQKPGPWRNSSSTKRKRRNPTIINHITSSSSSSSSSATSAHHHQSKPNDSHLPQPIIMSCHVILFMLSYNKWKMRKTQT
ncbi:hypothetical protein VTN49DRAFT_3215 [Thermomyces lanuginosus]|uniref:uncharacterized protein n=1 Tax=Thermomyces lanuginosus TaxID=5541 RepID=UPI0037442EE5